VISTIISDIDEFSQIVEGKRPGWSVHNVTIHDAIRDGHCLRDGSPINIDELRLDVPDPAVFACEFENVPLTEADSFMGRELLDACVSRWDPAFRSGSLYGGFDIARSERGHRSIIAEVRRDGDRYQGRVVMSERGMEFEAQEQTAIRSFQDLGWVRMAIDASGIGAGSAERIRKRLGSARIAECKFSPQFQVDLMTDLKAAMLKGTFAIDPSDRDLWLDLYAIKYKIGAGGRIGFEANVSERGHADRAWALALAVRAAGKGGPSQPFTFAAVPSRTSKRGW
jgi:phage FluMu gp28-like protein